MNSSRPISRSGRFLTGPAPEMIKFSESVSFDYRLWKHDILGSIAHAKMLRKIGLLTQNELDEIVSGLTKIAQRIQSGDFQWDINLEDVHMNIESALVNLTPAGAKLHTGRSRNDQVALDTRMWLREQLVEIDQLLANLQQALLDLGKRHIHVLIPGYTHLQRAQPVYLAHHLIAYVEMFHRDRERMACCFNRTNICPLGSGALAGSTLPLDRKYVATQLGFVDQRGRPRIASNSMDAVSDRDFAMEFCAAAAILGIHLSRLSEDLILWSSNEFGFITIDDSYTTGSSLMPQKRNPDAVELIRGKTGRLIGNLTTLLTLMKGLPMTYNRDMQEDKPPLFDTVDTVRACLQIMAAMLAHTSVNHAACQKAASDPALLATDLVDHLVLKGVPFRRAHHLVGALVAQAEKLGKPIPKLTPEELQQIDPLLEPDCLKMFDLHSAMKKRRVQGAPSPANVRAALRQWQKRIHEKMVKLPPGPYLKWLV